MKHRVLLVTVLSCTLFGTQAQEAEQATSNPLTIQAIQQQGPEYDYIKPLAGSWQVTQTIYEKHHEKVMMQDTFLVERKMIGNFLQEIMTPMSNEQESFQRVSYLSYNRTNKRWEYIVLDTRYPLMMYEESVNHRVIDNSIELYKSNFICPPFWGLEHSGKLAKQRRIITFEKNRNINEQYWTLPGEDEFLAIRYVFERID